LGHFIGHSTLRSFNDAANTTTDTLLKAGKL